MNNKAMFLAIILACSAGFSSLSNASLIPFKVNAVVDVTSPGAPPIGAILMDSLELFLTDGKISDIDDVLAWASDDTGLDITPTSVDLDYTSLMLSGFMEGTIEVAPGLVANLREDWVEGSGRFSLKLGDVVLIAGTNNIAAVPVPATLALFGLGLAGLGFSRRTKV